MAGEMNEAPFVGEVMETVGGKSDGGGVLRI
jgi:hypothetical protein